MFLKTKTIIMKYVKIIFIKDMVCFSGSLMMDLGDTKKQ